MTRWNRFSDHLQGHGSPAWLRELAELAAVFVTVGAAHLLANLLGHQQHGPILLIALGVALLTCAAVLRGALRRRLSRGETVRRDRAVRRWLRHAGRRTPMRRGGATALWRIRTTVDDAPGTLAALTESLSHLSVNILSVELHPVGHAVTDELIVEAPHRVGATELAATIRDAHGADIWVGPADVHDLTDQPTRILGLAARVVADPEELPVALHELYRGTLVSWSPRRDDAAALDGTTMRLDDPHGGQLSLTRPDLPFSPAELARARALVNLAAVQTRSDRL